MRILGALLLLVACSRAAGTSEPCLHDEERFGRKLIGPSSISVLYVVHGLDERARAELVRTAPAFLEGLRTGDLDADGVADFDAAPSVHVAVTTADLGGPAELGCAYEPSALVTNGGARFVASREDDFVPEVQARLRAARSSCPLAQPLEAARRALELDPAGPWPPFVATGERLVLVFATSADDCSGASSSALSLPVDVACTRAERAPLDDYVTTFLGFDTYALVIAGLPAAVDGLSAPLDGAAVLARPELAERVVDGALAPSCAREGWSATPPRRLLAWSDRAATEDIFPLHASICGDAFDAAFDALVARIGRVDRALCFTGLPPRGADGLLPCTLYERAEGCETRPGRELTEDGCRVMQRAPDGEGPGWWLETREDALEGSDLPWICPGSDRLDGEVEAWTRVVCARSSCE